MLSLSKMNTSLKTGLLLTIALSCCQLSLTHPIFQHQFNNIVNSNPCLRTCMDQATVGGVELSVLKTANISFYLLNLDHICSAIFTARSCISGCGIDSNPFALESMTSVCFEESLADVALVRPCLTEQGDEVVEQCRKECGNYDEINDHVHQLTKSIKPEVEPEKVAEVMSQINNACGTLKCSDRCVTKLLTEQCTPMESGKDAGSVVRALIERVLRAQRRDLERMQLVDAMAHSVPIQCNFMYMPEVMFNATKDEMALAMIGEERKKERLQKPTTTKAVAMEVTNTDADKKKDLSLALSHLQAQLLSKQMHLLDIQERNLMRESEKLDLELQMLARKRAQANYEEGMSKQF